MRPHTPLEAAIDLLGRAAGEAIGAIEETHAAAARAPFALLRPVAALGDVAEIVRVVHDGVAKAAYASARGGVRLGALAARLAATASGAGAAEPAAGTPLDLALSALNGFAGDRLAAEGSPLACGMTLRHAGRAVAVERSALAAAFPRAASRLAVFVHGLACNETLWWRHAERHHGDARVSYGTRLEADLGYTALYVRYNTGLAIAENGRALADLLERLIAAWPAPAEEIALIGHSMGGLVIRSAAHHGRDRAWASRTRHCVYLGSPHLGAPLEKAAAAAVPLLDRVPVTRPLAQAVARRSRGIRDLGSGTLCDPEGDATVSRADAAEVPLLVGAAHYCIAATLTRDPRHPLGFAIGDLLVREASASGRGRTRRLDLPIEHGRHFGAMGHLDLLNHPDVYEQIARWLRASRRDLPPVA